MTSTAASLCLTYTTLQTNFMTGPCLLQLNSEETDLLTFSRSLLCFLIHNRMLDAFTAEGLSGGS